MCFLGNILSSFSLVRVTLYLQAFVFYKFLALGNIAFVIHAALHRLECPRCPPIEDPRCPPIEDPRCPPIEDLPCEPMGDPPIEGRPCEPIEDLLCEGRSAPMFPLLLGSVLAPWLSLPKFGVLLSCPLGE